MSHRIVAPHSPALVPQARLAQCHRHRPCRTPTQSGRPSAAAAQEHYSCASDHTLSICIYVGVGGGQPGPARLRTSDATVPRKVALFTAISIPPGPIPPGWKLMLLYINTLVSLPRVAPHCSCRWLHPLLYHARGFHGALLGVHCTEARHKAPHPQTDTGRCICVGRLILISRR